MIGSPSTLHALTTLVDEHQRPYAKIEPMTGKMYSLDEKFLYRLDQMDMEDSGGGALGDTRVFNDRVRQDNMKSLSRYAESLERSKQYLVASRDCAHGGGRQINMDLAPSDVHIQSALSNFAGGYSLEDGVADLACPVIPVQKDADKYFIWDSANAFSRVIPNIGVAGAPPSEVSPTLSNSPYQTVPYALATAITLEVESNADAPLRPYQAAVERLHNALRLEREYRVMNLLTTSSNWASNNVLTLAAGAGWDNGPSSDPIANIHYILQHSAQKVTRIVMGEPVLQAMQRNQAVRSYYFAKDKAPALPSGEEIAGLFKIPPIVCASMKYTTGGALQYVWPSQVNSSSAVVFIHEPPMIPPTDQKDNMTSCTFRWTNAPTEGMTVTGGFAVRSYFDQRRGGRGSRVVVLAHNDIEVMTGNILGGLILNVIQ